MIELKNNPAGNFFLLAGPCVIEGEEMAMRIAERIVTITEKLQIPYVFKGSYRKANRSRLDSFMGIGNFLHQLLPKDFCMEDLMVVLLLLSIACVAHA